MRKPVKAPVKKEAKNKKRKAKADSGITGKVVKWIHFEDCGQDFLKWGLDANNVVVESAQGFVWNGSKVFPETIKKGRCVQFLNRGTYHTLAYAITKIEEVKP